MDDQPITTAEPNPSEALSRGTQDGNPNENIVKTTAQAPTLPPGAPPRPSQGQGKLSTVLRKLRILLWKNYLLRKRAWISLIFEIIAVLYVTFATYQNGPLANSGATEVNAQAPEVFTQDEMIYSFADLTKGKEVLYAPKGHRSAELILSKIDDIIRPFANQTLVINWTAVPTEKDVGIEFNKMSAHQRPMFEAAIIFETLGQNEIKYKIRMAKDSEVDVGSLVHSRTDILFPVPNPPGPNEAHKKAYSGSGFLGLQLLIDEAAVQVLRNNPTGFNQSVILKSFPYPKYKQFSAGSSQTSFGMNMILIFMVSNTFLAKNVAGEKETGVRELMKLCGYPGWMQWLAWHLVPLLVESIAFFILICLLVVVGAFKPSFEGFLLWFFILILAEISNNVFVFFMCSFLKSTTVATAAVLILTFFVSFGVACMFGFAKKVTFLMVMGVSILPHGCLVVALVFLVEYEQFDEGASWALLGKPLLKTPGTNMALVILMFHVNIVLYQSLAVYLESILPSEFGVRKPWYYPIQAIIALIANKRSKKGINATTATSSKMTGLMSESQSQAAGFELYQGQATKIGVDVQNLVKKFDGNKVAVNRVSLKMYDGEIFALLGHNGAGKTTLISMLTGMFAPTSGSAKVGGFDITKDLDKVRQSLGLCPQHDMLFNNLTVMEHLLVFGLMKSQSSEKVKQEARHLLSMMNLTDKENVISKKLSGGQKRKLCLGMALIGEAKVVILDEPTSGMDPEARRAIWDILSHIRGQRTILLTTHHMEEADVLGDRIGIMAEGKLQCCGSASFLKSFYGEGYTLKMALLPDADKYAIQSLVQKHVSNASIKPINMPNEVFISLPTETASPSALSSLFSALTREKHEMHIESIGLSVATMDDIFVKVGELSEKAAVDAKSHTTKPSNLTTNLPSPPPATKEKPDPDHEEHDKKKSKKKNRQDQNELVDSPDAPPITAEVDTDVPSVDSKANEVAKIPPTTSATTRAPTKSKSRGCVGSLQLIFAQGLEIFIKRFISTRRKFVGFFIFQLVLPALLTIGIVCGTNAIFEPGTIPPALKITLDVYKNPITFYSADTALENGAKQAISSTGAKKVDNVENELNKIAKSDMPSFRGNLIVAGEITADDCVAWFNTIPLHAAPLAINLASNIRGSGLAPPFKFRVTNHPLQTKEAVVIKAAASLGEVSGFYIGFLLCFLMMLPLMILGVSFIKLPIEERLNKSRQLQLMTGIHPLIYWIVTFLWDFLIVMLVAGVMISVLAIFQIYQLFSSYGGLWVILFLILAYGYVIISLAYLVSNLPISTSGGVAILIIFQLVSVIVAVLSVIVTLLHQGKPVAFGWMARLIPNIGVGLSFFFVGTGLADNAVCNLLGKAEKDIVCSGLTADGEDIKRLRACCHNCSSFPGIRCFSPRPFISWTRPAIFEGDLPGIGQILVSFLVLSLTCQAIHLVIQLGGLRFIRRLMIKAKNSDFLDQVDDEDVQEEKKRIADLIGTKQTGSDALVVSNLSKNYGGLSAVSKLTFGVHHGECFGLLGTNGAGKTTTFRIITGDELQSLGDAYEGRLSLTGNRRKFISNIGYCPQFDAFIPYMTGRENLKFFGRLRGVPCRQLNMEADKWLEKVGLKESGKVQCKKYSGGMKRRLSAAIALIGDPDLLLLDEPTSGVDPVSRRQFWKIVESVKASGKSVILTSHSMDECEALCSRLGIMVNGQLQCIGGVQHLKHKFAQGYSLTLRLKHNLNSQQQQPSLGMNTQQQNFGQGQGFAGINIQQPPSNSPSFGLNLMQKQQTQQNLGALLTSLNNEICEKFHPCILKDQHETVLQYQIENTMLGWDVLYKTLEDLKKSYEDVIADYSVSETSLEEVFLAFSRKQYPPRETKISLGKRILTCQC